MDKRGIRIVIAVKIGMNVRILRGYAGMEDVSIQILDFIVFAILGLFKVKTGRFALVKKIEISGFFVCTLKICFNFCQLHMLEKYFILII